MKLGILGPPQSGKTTLFNAVTRGQAESGSARGEKVHLGSVRVPDARLERLREMHSPKKFTPAKVDYVDAPPLETARGERGALSALTALRDVDAFVLVIRAFEDPTVPHFQESVDAARDAGWLLSELILAEPGLVRMIRVSYATLGLISFFTVGPDEVRAWTVPEGALAPQAAGAIHSDLERGFIRAEVISYEDLARTGGMPKAKEMGLLRTEGRDYKVRDGDVVNI